MMLLLVKNPTFRLIFLKGPSIDYLIFLFFELTHMYVKQKQRRLSGALTLGLGPISGELCIAYT